jgi:two-component system LytT family response regulator
VFLDIEMPGLSGFDLLARIGEPPPLVVFTTAYEQYALAAFKADSIGYLVKPITQAELDRVVARLERLLQTDVARVELAPLLEQLRAVLMPSSPEHLTRVASRAAGRVEFVDVADVSYFYAKDKLTFAVTGTKHHALDLSLAELERRLPPGGWLRIHRATLLNMSAVASLHGWFGGKLLIRLKDGADLPVARERAAEVRAKLGLGSADLS